MSSPTAEVLANSADHEPRGSCWTADFALRDHIDAILDNPDFIENIANFPEADARQRFARLRVIRSQYVEWKVVCLETMYDDQLERRRKYGWEDGTADEYETLMLEIDKALSWHSRIYKEDGEIVRAPTVVQHFMDHTFRDSLHKKPRVPNGRSALFYGSRGDPVPPELMATEDVQDSPFRDLIMKSVMVPFRNHVYEPLRTRYRKWMNREDAQEATNIDDQTLNTIAHGLECIFPGGLVAGTVILLYNLESMRNRLIAASFLALVFPYSVSFLSKDAMLVYALMAAYWAVLSGVIFGGLVSCNSMHS